MDSMQDKSLYIFLIDTNKYAGEFYRNLCAYMTGRLGVCSVGKEQAYAFYSEMGIIEKDSKIDEIPLNYWEDLNNPFDFLIDVPDDHGSYRPVEVSLNLKGDYNSVAIYMHRIPNESEIKLLTERAINYTKNNNIKIEMFRIIHREIKNYQVLQWAKKSVDTL